MTFVRTMLAGVAVMLSAAVSPAQAADFEMNFTTPYFDRHETVIKVFRPWIEKIASESNGEIEISYFAPNTICPEKETFDSVVQGVLEIGANMTSRNPGQFAAAEIVQMPMLNVSPRNAAVSWWDLSQQFPEQFPEFKTVKLLGCWTGAMNAIHTVSKPVRKLEDMKGLRIITSSATNIDILRLLGATPMQMSNADTYLALERGMADGVMTAVSPLRSQKLTDILRYHTITNINCTPFWCAMNKDLYEELPDNLRKVIDDNSGRAFSEAVGQSLEDSTNNDIRWIQEQGKAEVIVLDDAERQRWAAALEPVLGMTREKMVEAGIPMATVDQMLDYYMERVKAN